MKQFFGAFFGSCLGIFITGIAITLIIIYSISSTIKNSIDFESKKVTIVKKNSILKVDLDGEIQDRGVENPFGELDLGPFMPKAVIGLNDIIASIEKAKTDDKIKGIYLNVSNPVSGFATMEEVRNALLDFKKSGKFIYAYSEMYSQKAYYMATVANKIYLNPQGGMEIKGLSTQLMFFKNMLDKLNIEVQIFRHGKFKSAIEPYMLDKMSQANREQVETYLNSIWNQMTKGISEQRKITEAEINNIANTLAINTVEDAIKYKFIDEMKYEDEVLADLRKAVKISENDKLHFVSLEKYASKVSHKAKSKNKIAVIYASGSIESGKGDNETIGSETTAKAIRDARLDTTIKAIVLRVNSPGGSALASDVIWREVLLAKQSKPFIVSMGDLAASGGYYISCAADRIFAQPNTITGSIGVFGMIPNAQKALSEKLGITIDTVNTNKHSDVGTILRKATPNEFNYIQQSVERIYDVFIGRVAEGRNMTKAQVDSIGQGRVWSGTDAIKINLVDELGSLNDAVNYAAKTSKCNDFKIIELPKQKDPIEELLNMNKDEMETRSIKSKLGEHYTYILQVKHVLSLKGIQARLPYELIIE
jgi:protease-4